MPIDLKLDLSLLYLRRVHAYCLYCGEEYEDERMLSTRCGPQHIRNYQRMDQNDFDDLIKNHNQLFSPLMNPSDNGNQGDLQEDNN